MAPIKAKYSNLQVGLAFTGFAFSVAGAALLYAINPFRKQVRHMLKLWQDIAAPCRPHISRVPTCFQCARLYHSDTISICPLCQSDTESQLATLRNATHSQTVQHVYRLPLVIPLPQFARYSASRVCR